MSEVNPNAAFNFEGVSIGFRIEDDDYAGFYFSSNYQSALSEEAKLEMD